MKVSNGKEKKEKDYSIIPIQAITTKPPMNFTPEICSYTKEGRERIHKDLQTVNWEVLRYLRDNPVKNQSAEYNDNRISLYCGQQGLCYITKLPLQIGNMEVHHIEPRSQNGSDEYENLLFITTDVHRLIHCTIEETENRLLEKLKLDDKMIKKVNSLRKKCGSRKLGERKVIA